jgi:PAS domain S-box-containing protein
MSFFKSKNLRSINISLWLPLIFILSYFILLGSITFQQKSLMESYYINEAISDFDEDMRELQLNIQNDLNNNQLLRARRFILNEGVHFEYKHLALFNPEMITIFSTNETTNNKSIIESVPEFDLGQFNEVLKNKNKSTFINEKERHVKIYYPINLNQLKDHDLRDSKLGGLFLYADYSHFINQIWHSVWEATRYFWLIGFLVFLLIYFLVKKYITAPLRLLTNQIHNYKQGSFNTFQHIHGSGEISVLSDNFIEMAKKTDQQYTEIKKNESYLKNLIDNEPECVKVLSNDARLLEMNPAGLKLIGANSLEEVKGSSIYDLIHPDYKEEFEQLHQNVINGQSRLLTFKIITLNGVERWMETHAVPIFDGKGNVTKHFAVTRDITVNMEFDKALQTIANGVSYSYGKSFFKNMVNQLSSELNLDCILITKSDLQNSKLCIIAASISGQIIEELTCNLTDTPCGKVVKASKIIYEPDLQKEYSHVPLIKENNFNEYLGCPLINSTGKVIGTVSIMQNNPFTDKNKLEYILQIFASRIAAEIEKMEASSELNEAEKSFELIFRETPEPMLLSSLDNGKIFDVNNAFEKASGYTHDDVIGKTTIQLSLFSNNDDREIILHYIKTQGHIRNYEFIGITKSGKEKFFNISSDIIKLGNKSIILSILHDITEQKTYEKTLSIIAKGLSFDSGDILLDKLAYSISDLFDSDFVLLGMLTKDYTIKTRSFYTEKNKSENFEYELKNTPCENVIDSKRPCIYTNDIQALFPKDQLLIDMDIVSYVGVPLLDSKRNTIGILAVLFKRELTEEKNLLEYILSIFSSKASGELEKVFFENKQKLLQSQLYESQKMEAIGQFTSGIAHDFNNILSSIIGYTNLAQSLSTEEKTQNYLGEVYRAGNRAKDLVNKLLEYSRKDSSSPKLVDVKNSINENITMLKPIFPTSFNITVKDTIQNDVDIFIDPVQFQQILMNLLVNARDASNNHGNIDILINKVITHERVCVTCNKNISGELVEISISDSGCGLTNEIQNKIFEPLFTTKPKGEGTGLGLSVVNSLIHSFEGHIDIVSKENVGTTFMLYFPVANNKNHVEIDRKIPHQLITKNQNDLNINAHILVVDDEKPIVALLEEYLENKGLKITAMTDSLQAKDFIIKNHSHLDMIISDQTMPSITGIELADILREKNSEIPFILISGYSNVINKNKIDASGITTLLKKPLDLDDLYNLIIQYLNNPKSTNEAYKAAAINY